jgi:hypothetical protein
MGLFGRSRERRCRACAGAGRIVVEASASYRRTAHCYACDGTGRVRLLADGRPEPGWGWGRPDSTPPPIREAIT